MRIGRILSGITADGIPAIDVELLLAKVLNVTRANLKAYPERELTHNERKAFDSLLQRRMQGEPIAYLIGHKEFWSLDFLVTSDVLIPRPDTELLVEIALENLENNFEARILDLGTGCGTIALSIAAERPELNLVATDASADALQIAKLNAKNFHISNVEFVLSNWFDAIPNDANNLFDMILSNPPYVAQYDPHLAQGDLRFEPERALVAGIDGMDSLRVIIEQAYAYLKPEGLLLVEHGYDQEHPVANVFARAGFNNITCYRDLSGIPRVSVGSKF